MEALRKINVYLRKFTDYIIFVAMVIMSVLYFLQVVFRYFTTIPLAWVEEVCLVTLIFMVRIGPNGLVKPDRFIKIDLLQLSPKVNKWLSLIMNIVVVVMLCLLVWHGFRMMVMFWPQKMAITGMSRGYLYMAIGIGSLMMLLGFIERVIDNALELFGSKFQQEA